MERFYILDVSRKEQTRVLRHKLPERPRRTRFILGNTMRLARKPLKIGRKQLDTHKEELLDLFLKGVIEVREKGIDGPIYDFQREMVVVDEVANEVEGTSERPTDPAPTKIIDHVPTSTASSSNSAKSGDPAVVETVPKKSDEATKVMRSLDRMSRLELLKIAYKKVDMPKHKLEKLTKKELLKELS